MINHRSFVGRFINKNSVLFSDVKIKNYIFILIEILRDHGIKEKFIVLILQDFVNKKFFNFIKIQNVFIKISNHYFIDYELTDPESRFFDSYVFINIPIEYVKKNCRKFWKLSDSFINFFDKSKGNIEKKNSNIIQPEFLTIIKHFLGNIFKIDDFIVLIHDLQSKENKMNFYKIYIKNIKVFRNKGYAEISLFTEEYIKNNDEFGFNIYRAIV